MNRSEAGKLGYIKTKEAMDAARDRKTKRCREQYLALNKKCLFCGKEISFKGRKNDFCNHSCAAQHTRKIKGNKIRKGYTKNCPCGLEVKVGNKYCDKCILEGKHLHKKTFEALSLSSRGRRRQCLLDERGNICEMCGITEWLGKPILLIMDHIDGNSSNEDKLNMRLICSNCDSTLSTYKGRNKGNGRHARRARYAEGKSY